MLRTLTACLGIFGVFNCLLGFIHPQWDANLWWIDVRSIPRSGRARVGWRRVPSVVALCALACARIGAPLRHRYGHGDARVHLPF